MGLRIGACVGAGVSLAASLACSHASADSRVLVVALESRVPGVSAAPLDRALRAALAEVPSVRLAGTATVASLVRGSACAGFDDICREHAAERQRVDRLVYGHLEPGPDDTLRVQLSLFDLYGSATVHTLEGALDLDDVDDEDEHAELFAKLAPLVVRWPEEGAALVRAIPGSRVQLDGREMGEVPASGELLLRPLRVGRRVLRVVRPNQVEWVAPVLVPSRAQISVTVDAGSALAGLVEGDAPPARPEGTIEPPPAWVLAIPGVAEPTDDGIFAVGAGVHAVHFHIPLIREHVRRGEIRTTTEARLGWLPRVTATGARMTARVHF